MDLLQALFNSRLKSCEDGFFFFETITATAENESLFLPLLPSALDYKGLEELIPMTNAIRERYNPRLNLLGVLLAQTNAQTNLDRDLYAMLQDFFGDKLFNTTIGVSVKQREATFRGKSILEYLGDHQGAAQFRALAGEIEHRLLAADETMRTSNDNPEKQVANR